jgi:N-methylhydantoinase A
VTVTDANLYVGRLSPEHFLGGKSHLDPAPAAEAVERFAQAMGLTPMELALGILRVANATMERAIRVISLERGFDPRDFSLMCFGGAGGMHAADLARSLAIPRVIVPRAAGVLSALGMLLADVVRDYSLTVLKGSALLGGEQLDTAFAELERRAFDDLAGEGFGRGDVQIERTMDVRYVGQGFELAVSAEDGFERSFHDAHEQRYGYADPARATEVVNLRVRATGQTAKPQLLAHPRTDAKVEQAVVAEQPMVVDGSTTTIPLYDRERLEPGHLFSGPALVVEYSTTTVVPPDCACRMDDVGNLILEFRDTP